MSQPKPAIGAELNLDNRNEASRVGLGLNQDKPLISLIIPVYNTYSIWKNVSAALHLSVLIAMKLFLLTMALPTVRVNCATIMRVIIQRFAFYIRKIRVFLRLVMLGLSLL